MNAVAHLASLLAPAVRIGGLPMPMANHIDTVIEALQGQLTSRGDQPLPVDLQHDTVRRFWDTRRLETLKDARLVAFGLCLPAGPEDDCVLGDGPRFTAVLDGIDQWLHDPRWYRRGYQGLLWSYFNCDIDADGTSAPLRQNWLRLRDYLGRRASRTVDRVANPDWVKTVVCHRHLFTDTPCERHAAQLLRGDRRAVDLMSAQLGIGGSSWFFHQLIMAQVTAATALDDDAFCAALPSLIDLLSDAPTLRDEELARLLARHDRVRHTPLHAGLRDAAAGWWGLPWRPSNALRWSGLTDGLRNRVSGWIKADLIDRFFARCGDGPGRRRAAFWQRYVKSIQKIEFATGDQALQAAGWPAGPRATTGLGTPLRDGSPSDRAMVLTMGRAVVVEFSDPSIALHGYDLRQPLPFDMSQPLALATDADNSLRQRSRCLFLAHQDGLFGWRQWEQMFEAALSDQFGLRPGTAVSADPSSYVDLSGVTTGLALGSDAPDEATDEPRWQTASAGEDVHWLTAEAASVPYSRADLEVLARVHALRIDDQTTRTGRLWVRSDDTDPRIARVLRAWGFVHEPGEGWRQ